MKNVKNIRISRKTNTPEPPRFMRYVLEFEAMQMNQKRAKWAKQTLKFLENLTGTSKEDAVSDLLQYMMHLCDRNGRYGDFDEAMETAIRNYETETAAHPNWQ